MFNGSTASFDTVASGALCLTDGTVMEVFCKMDRVKIIAKLGNAPASDPEFKSEFALVKKGVEGAEKVELAGDSNRD